MEKNEKNELAGAVLGRRLARELTNEEMAQVSGADFGQYQPTDWNADYGEDTTSGWNETSTGGAEGQDGDYKKDGKK